MRAASALFVFLAGCNLTLDLGEYAYQEIPVLPGPADMQDAEPDQPPPPDSPPDLPPDMPADVGMDVEPDQTERIEDISLIFTELLTNTSESPQELSEYFEVVNLSPFPIDPMDLLIKSFKGEDPLTTLSISAFDRDTVSPIPPMGHFTFVRRMTEETGLDTYLVAGAYYEYGVRSESFALGNSGERRLELYHAAQNLQDAPLDVISWTALRLKFDGDDSTLDLLEDRALSLAPEAYDPDLNGDVAVWCYDPNVINGPSIALRGSPGRALEGDCVREP